MVKFWKQKDTEVYGMWRFDFSQRGVSFKGACHPEVLEG